MVKIKGKLNYILYTLGTYILIYIIYKEEESKAKIAISFKFILWSSKSQSSSLLVVYTLFQFLVQLFLLRTTKSWFLFHSFQQLSSTVDSKPRQPNVTIRILFTLHQSKQSTIVCVRTVFVFPRNLIK